MGSNNQKVAALQLPLYAWYCSDVAATLYSFENVAQLPLQQK